jgi:hypothetical protein
LIYLEIYPWSRVLLQKLITQLDKELPTFYETRRFINVFTRTRQWSRPWARWHHSTPTHYISIRSNILIYPNVTFHVRLSLLSGILLFTFSDDDCSWISHFSQAYYRPRLFYPPWFDRPNNMWRSIQVTKLLITQSSPVSCYFHSLTAKYSPQHSILIQSQSVLHSGFFLSFLNTKLCYTLKNLLISFILRHCFAFWWEDMII